SKIKKASKRKLALLVVVLTLGVSGTAYAAYKIPDFNGDKKNVTRISGILTEVEDLTKTLKNTSNSLSSEKVAHSSDVNDANKQISKANDYSSSVSSALQSTTEDTSNASAAISTASSAVSYDPSTSSSSGK
ncbi:hypothetical protein KQ236_16315, partial [Lactococcus lactis]|nr:hypothetical protein [Lactococcus lactis]